MIYLAVLCFAVAALGGLTLAYLFIFARKGAPLELAVLHGLFAVAGVALLLTCVVKTGLSGRLPIALGFFLGAALGGLVLFWLHLRGKMLPPTVIGLHGGLALAGFLTLLDAVFWHTAAAA